MSRPRIEAFLRSARFAHRCIFALQLLLLVFAAGVLALLMPAISAKYTTGWGIASAIALSSLLLTVGALVVARFARRTERRLAHELDQHFELKDRLITYLEIRSSAHPFLPALAAETETRLAPCNPWKAVGVRQQIGPSLGAAFIVVSAFFLIPYLPVSQEIARAHQEQKQVQEQARQLERVLEDMQKKKDVSPAMKRFLAEAIKQAQDLQKPDVPKSEALKNLNALQQKLARLQAEETARKQNELSKMLQQLDGAKQSDAAQSDPSAAKDLDKLAQEIQKALGDQFQPPKQEASTDASKSLSRQDLETMKKALEDYKKDATESKKQMAEAQKALEGAQKGMGQSSHKVTSNSKISDRDVEKSKGGVDDGPGTTNADMGPHHFDTKKQGSSSYAEDRTKAQYEQQYKGERTKAGNDPFFLSSQWNESGELRSQSIRSFGQDSQPALAHSGSAEALQNQDESEIRKEKVPATYQKMVNQYFESIEGQ